MKDGGLRLVGRWLRRLVCFQRVKEKEGKRSLNRERTARAIAIIIVAVCGCLGCERAAVPARVRECERLQKFSNFLGRKCISGVMKRTTGLFGDTNTYFQNIDNKAKKTKVYDPGSVSSD